MSVIKRQEAVTSTSGSMRQTEANVVVGLKCMDCEKEVVYDYKEDLYICLGCGI